MEAKKVPIDLNSLSEARRGFAASLNAASLADLVQLECLSGTTCVARISAEDEVGYLYFRGGRIVHAVSASNIGEAAALEILGWEAGSFEMCNAGWPDSDSIHAPFQSLLMRVAQARDEGARDNLLRFPNTNTKPPPPQRPPLASDTEEATPPSGVTKVRAAARLDAHGEVRMAKGQGSRELADSAALAVRLSRLIGDSLGLEGLASVEATSTDQRVLLLLESDGGVLALRAPMDVDLSSLRARYGA